MEEDFMRIVKGKSEAYDDPIYALEVTLRAGDWTIENPERNFNIYYSFAKRYLWFNDPLVGKKDDFEVIEEVFLPNNINLKEYEAPEVTMCEIISEWETVSEWNTETIEE